MSALLSIHRLHFTQAEPSLSIRGMAFLFSGHFAPTLPIIAFRSACPIAKVSARYANLIPFFLFNLIAVSLFSISVLKYKERLSKPFRIIAAEATRV